MVGLSTNPAHKKGISALGYYISKGILKTDVDHLEDAWVYFKDVVLRDKTEKPTVEEVTQAVQEDPKDSKAIDSIDDINWDNIFAPMTGQPRKDPLSEDYMLEARKIVAKLTDLSEDDVEI